MKIFFSILSFLIYCNCNSQSISGKLLDETSLCPLFSAKVYLVDYVETKDTVNTYRISGIHKIISQTKTDLSGSYKFAYVKPGKYNLIAETDTLFSQKLNYFGVKIKIDSNISISSGTSYLKDFYLMYSCPYANTANQIFCPICNKTDKVKEVFFGLPIYSKEGEMSDELFYAGCIEADLYCNPTKRCIRCEKFF